MEIPKINNDDIKRAHEAAAKAREQAEQEENVQLDKQPQQSTKIADSRIGSLGRRKPITSDDVDDDEDTSALQVRTPVETEQKKDEIKAIPLPDKNDTDSEQVTRKQKAVQNARAEAPSQQNKQQLHRQRQRQVARPSVSMPANQHRTPAIEVDPKTVEERRKREQEERESSQRRSERMAKLRSKVSQFHAMRNDARQQYQRVTGMTPEQGKQVVEYYKALQAQAEREAIVEQMRISSMSEEERAAEEAQKQFAQLPLWLRVVLAIDSWDTLEALKKTYPPYSMFVSLFDDDGDMIRTVDACAIDAGLYNAEMVVGNDAEQFAVAHLRFAIAAAAFNIIEEGNIMEGDRDQLVTLIRYCANIFANSGAEETSENSGVLISDDYMPQFAGPDPEPSRIPPASTDDEYEEYDGLDRDDREFLDNI